MQPKTSLLGLLSHYFQTFSPSQLFDPFMIHLPVLPSQQNPNPILFCVIYSFFSDSDRWMQAASSCPGPFSQKKGKRDDANGSRVGQRQVESFSSSQKGTRAGEMKKKGNRSLSYIEGY